MRLIVVAVIAVTCLVALALGLGNRPRQIAQSSSDQPIEAIKRPVADRARVSGAVQPVSGRTTSLPKAVLFKRRRQSGGAIAKVPHLAPPASSGSHRRIPGPEDASAGKGSVPTTAHRPSSGTAPAPKQATARPTGPERHVVAAPIADRSGSPSSRGVGGSAFGAHNGTQVQADDKAALPALRPPGSANEVPGIMASPTPAASTWFKTPPLDEAG